MRRFSSRISAERAISIGFAASTALLTATCTNDFASLYSGQGGSGGGASSSAASSGSSATSSGSGEPTLPCDAGATPMGDAATPPSTAFSTYCSVKEGCRTSSTLACNLCGANCDEFDCPGPQCTTWCSLGTSCLKTKCNGDKCAFYCDGCKGQLLGTAQDVKPVQCSGKAECEITLEAGMQNNVEVDCSGNSKCTVTTQANDTIVNCRENSTCDVRCKDNPTCHITLNCDSTSNCITRCPLGTPGCTLSCPGSKIDDCGAAGLSCNRDPACGF